jgi:hypothetical protein
MSDLRPSRGLKSTVTFRSSLRDASKKLGCARRARVRSNPGNDGVESGALIGCVAKRILFDLGQVTEAERVSESGHERTACD